MYVWNNFKKDDRVKKKALTLSKQFDVTVHSVVIGNYIPDEQYTKNIKVRYYCLKNRLSWLFFRTIGNFWFWKSKTDYCSIVDCNDPDTLWAGWHNKKQYPNIKIVYDTHEYWKGTRRKEYFLAYTLYSYICNTWHYFTEKLLYKIADSYICVSPRIHNLLNKMYNRYFRVIANKSTYNKNNKDISNARDYACFIGSYMRPGADAIGDCFYDKGIQPLAIGGECKSEKWKNLGFQDKPAFREILNKSKFGILGYTVNCDNIRYSLPNKLFEYAQAECPVITISSMESVSDIVRKYNIGVVADSLKYEDISNAINILLKNYDTYISNIRKHKYKLSWESQEAKLLTIYGGLL